MARLAIKSKAQTFRITAPDARSVLLAGDFTQWQRHAIAMRKEKGGVWEASVELQPGKHTYRFVVDGEWHDDPECTVRVPNPFGGQDISTQLHQRVADFDEVITPGDKSGRRSGFGPLANFCFLLSQFLISPGPVVP